MLWEPAFATLLTTRLSVLDALPAIGSPVFAVDASVAATLRSALDGSTQAASGQTVARINDAFGVNTTKSFQQFTAAEQPQLLASLAGGKPGLRFDGNSDWMYLEPQGDSGTLFQSRTFTMCAVYRRNRTDGQPGGVFAAGNSGGGDGANGFDTLLLEAGDTGPPLLVRGTGSEYGTVYLNAGTYQNNELSKVVVRSSQANGMEMRTRSMSGAYSGTGSIPASADSFTWDVAALGAELNYQGSGYPSYRFQGDIMEWRFWGARATDAQFTQLQAYLDSKWGA